MFVLYLIWAWDMPGKWMRYTWDCYMCERFLRYALYIPNLCMLYIPNIFLVYIPNKCLISASDILGIYMRFFWDLPKICFRYKRSMSEIYPTFALGEPSKYKIEKIWDNVPMGGGSEKNRNVPISIWEFWKQRGGGLYFSKMSQSQLFCDYFAILPL